MRRDQKLGSSIWLVRVILPCILNTVGAEAALLGRIEGTGGGGGGKGGIEGVRRRKMRMP